MKKLSPIPVSVRRAVGALGLMLGAGVLVASATDRQSTLEAIRNLENPRNLTRPGPCGELGPYQFRAATWRMHTAAPFSQALDREASDQVAARHYEWISRGLAGARLPVTPYNIALAWNGGLAAAVSGRSPRAAHRYAERAANLASALHEERRLATTR